MLSAVFILNATDGSLIVLKQCLHEVSKSLCNHFWQYVKDLPAGEAEPVFTAGSYRLIHILHESVYWVAAFKSDVFALPICQFLHFLQKSVCNYIKGATAEHISSRFDEVYLVLDHLIDAGMYSLLEPHTLPKLLGSSSSSSKEQSSGGFSSTSSITDAPLRVLWRDDNIKYSSNEIFLDFIEEVNCLLDYNGVTLSSSIAGKVVCRSLLSGNPELSLHLKNPRVMDQAFLHRCVRLKKWMKDRIISFIPP
ncbi:hypothetical protein GEMRC1_003162 [Eukaryota sp. GEM-RC1]